MADMVSKNLAAYEPPKQTKSVLLYWRSLDEWAEVLHEWVSHLLADCVLSRHCSTNFFVDELNWTAQYHHDIL